MEYFTDDETVHEEQSAAKVKRRSSKLDSNSEFDRLERMRDQLVNTEISTLESLVKLKKDYESKFAGMRHQMVAGLIERCDQLDKRVAKLEKIIKESQKAP